MRMSDKKEESYLARGFRDVDNAAVTKMASCLAFMDSLPSFQKYKNVILDALHPTPGAVIADLGCGLGFDVSRLGDRIGPTGRVLGVDFSAELLKSARECYKGSAAVDFIQSDIQKLPFDDEYLDACKVDRTLQHVENPSAVLKEMFRTVRPGGIIVCAEPDWGTFTIDHEDRAMVNQIAQSWGESFRNPWIGRQLMNGLRSAGFVKVEVRGILLVAPSFESSDKVFDLVQTARWLSDTTSSDSPMRWVSAARARDNIQPVWSSVTLFLYITQRP